MIILLSLPWYKYCYFPVGPNAAYPNFSHWSSDNTIKELKDDLCTDWESDGYNDFDKTDFIAACMEVQCPKICHYFKHDIVPAGEAAVGTGVIYIVTSIIAVFVIMSITCI